MPLPTRRKGEKQSDFMHRCMGDPAIKEFKTRDQQIAVCMSQSRKARHSEVALTLNLKEYTEGATLVFPLIAMTEGVRQAANSKYAELVEEGEITKSAPLWDGFPLTITHPRNAEGDYISAASPEAAPYIIGKVTKPDAAGGKLKLQAHLDLTKLSAVATNADLDEELRAEAKILTDRLRSGGQIEVSAGYFTYVEPEQGIYDYEGTNPQDYTGLQTAIDPDHIALLKTTQKGACSWEDGCGAPRMSEKLARLLAKEMGMDMGGSDTTGMTKCTNCDQMMPTDTTSCPYCGAASSSFKKKKKVMEDKAPCSCHALEEALGPARIAELIASAKPKGSGEDLRNTAGADRDGSVKQSASEEGTMGTEAGGGKDPKDPKPDPNPNPNPNPKPGSEGEHDPAAGAERKEPEAKQPVAAAAAKPPTWDDLFAAADPDMRYAMSQAREQAVQRRTQLVTFLKTNSAYSEDELKAKPLEELDKLYKTCLKVSEKAKPKHEEKKPDEKRANDGKDYSGRGLSANASGEADEDAPFTRVPEPAFKIGGRPELVQRRGKTASAA